MFDALQIAATGMQAQQLHVDTIANNLVNMNTVGFKKARVAFYDLVTRDTAEVARAQSDVEVQAVDAGHRVGSGVGVSGVAKVFDAGDVRKTDVPLDIAISGDGFFEVSLPDGSRAYTRGGSLKLNVDGMLSTQEGYPLKPGISVPDDTKSLNILADGRIVATVGRQSGSIELGQLEMVRFSSQTALTALGNNLYSATDASGSPIAGRPGDELMGTVRQGYLEQSNVKMVDEMVNLMIAQRAYEASVKLAQASDEMLGMVNTLRK